MELHIGPEPKPNLRETILKIINCLGKDKNCIKKRRVEKKEK
jgi:hypothetical protein